MVAPAAAYARGTGEKEGDTREAALPVMAAMPDEDTLDHDLKEIFRLVDTDGGGTSTFSLCLFCFVLFHLFVRVVFYYPYFCFVAVSSKPLRASPRFSSASLFIFVFLLLSVDMDELHQLMNLLGIPILDGQMARMVAEIASNDSGEISLEDFLSAMKSEGQNKHLRHLLRSDFNRFRPMDCPKGHIPKGELVKLLVKHFVTKEDGPVEGGDVNQGSMNGSGDNSGEDEPGMLSYSMGSNGAPRAPGGTLSLADSRVRLASEDESSMKVAQWTVTEIEDTLKQIPIECYHPTRHDWVNFEMLLNTMLGEDAEDPFAKEKEVHVKVKE